MCNIGVGVHRVMPVQRRKSLYGDNKDLQLVSDPNLAQRVAAIANFEQVGKFKYPDVHVTCLGV